LHNAAAAAVGVKKIKARAYNMNENKIKGEPSSAVVNRLPRYYRFLGKLLSQNILRISSGELALEMGVTASQIRQDLNCFGGFGQQGYGYNVKYLYGQIADILGVNEAYSAIIIGAGNLGHALAASSVFSDRGVFLKALFDSDDAVVGSEINGLTILAESELEKYFSENRVDIAVLTVPGKSAEKECAKLCRLGVRGIWNFSGVELRPHPNTVIHNMHTGDFLMTLCYALRKEDEMKAQKAQSRQDGQDGKNGEN
jgi:redox-sensing transcriptional repressor